FLVRIPQHWSYLKYQWEAVMAATPLENHTFERVSVMEWKLSEEQVDYQNVLRDWLQRVAPVDQVRGWLGTDGGPADPSDFERRLAADGMAGVGVPEELGGQGGGMVELALTAEEFARASVPSSAWLSTVLALPALAGRPDLVEA